MFGHWHEGILAYSRTLGQSVSMMARNLLPYPMEKDSGC